MAGKTLDTRTIELLGRSLSCRVRTTDKDGVERVDFPLAEAIARAIPLSLECGVGGDFYLDRAAHERSIRNAHIAATTRYDRPSGGRIPEDAVQMTVEIAEERVDRLRHKHGFNQ